MHRRHLRRAGPCAADRRARRTAGLTGTPQASTLALGGRAGARLSGQLASSASRSTLLRLIREALHHIRDVTYAEDTSQVRARSGPRIMATYLLTEQR